MSLPALGPHLRLILIDPAARLHQSVGGALSRAAFLGEFVSYPSLERAMHADGDPDGVPRVVLVPVDDADADCELLVAAKQSIGRNGVPVVALVASASVLERARVARRGAAACVPAPLLDLVLPDVLERMSALLETAH